MKTIIESIEEIRYDLACLAAVNSDPELAELESRLATAIERLYERNKP